MEEQAVTLRCRDFALILRLGDAAAVCLVALSATLHGATYYVAPDGSDAWSGRIEHPNADTTNGPFATPIGARNAIRKLKAQGPLVEAVEVIVAAGACPMHEPLVREPQDSGTSATPIVYRAAEGAKPVFSGARTITGFREDGGPRWIAEISEAVDGKWPFQLVGLTFQHADGDLPAGGYGDAQAAVTVPAVISASGARHCAIRLHEAAVLISTADKSVHNTQACERCISLTNHRIQS
jgi:hypothetical protein